MKDNSSLDSKARMEIAVYPLGTGEASVSEQVSAIFNVLDNCGLTYQITTMCTIIEGTLDELILLARKLHESMFSGHVKRVITTIKIDERREL